MTGSPAVRGRREHTRWLVISALMVSLLCVAAYLEIPLQPIPVTLQVLVVVLAALLLTPGWAIATVGAYLLLGVIGVPVFSGGQGGIGVIAGPTGGYLLGFAVAACAGSSARIALSKWGCRVAIADAVAAVCAIVAIYVLGVSQLALETRMGVWQAVVAGAVPFLIPDAIKASVAVGVARAVRHASRA